MSFNPKLWQWALILVAIPLAFEMIFAAFLLRQLNDVEREEHVIAQSKEVIAASHETRLAYENIVTKLFLHIFTASDSSYASLVAATKEFPNAWARLAAAVKDDPRENAICTRAGLQGVENFGDLQQRILQNKGVSGLLFVGPVKTKANDIQRLSDNLDEIVKLETAKGITEEKGEKLRQKLKESLIGGAVANLLLAAIVGSLFVTGTTRRLNVLMANTMRLSANTPLLPKIRGRDELAHLDSVFHKMARVIREASEKERAIVDNAQDVICVIDKNNKFSQVNPACTRMWGYDPSEIMGLRLAEIVVADDLAATMEAFEATKSGAKSATFENRMKHKNGNTIWTLWSAYRSSEDETLFCVAHDITDRKLAEELKQQFVAMITHDLRTPLTSIQFTLELLSRMEGTRLSQDWRDRLSGADESCVRLIELINNLLDVERLRSGRFELSQGICELTGIVQRSVDSVRGFAERHGVELVAHVQPVKVIADEERIIQVLVNLLSNAIKFSQSGQPVSIETQNEDGFVEVQVVDRGRGIPAAKIDEIFDRFSQVSKSDAHVKGRGSGLGLTICKAIVEEHGGTIGVRSEEGKGSTFWFRIRRA